MFVATWNGVEVARAASVIEVEGRRYFRPEDARLDLLAAAPDRSVCEWKGGEAVYFDIVAGGAVNRAAAWSYPRLGDIARLIEGRFAFWRGVSVSWQGAGAPPPVLVVEAKTPNVAKALGFADVIWQPDLPPAIIDPNQEPFAGYLVPSLHILVHVVATPPKAELADRIAEAHMLAKRIMAWNATGCGEPYGFIAVWGSATPSAPTVAMLRNRAIIVDLRDECSIGPGPRPVGLRDPRRHRQTKQGWC